MVDFTAIEKKWQQRWYNTKLYEATLDDGDEPFFIHFAYPGISGFLHVGHMLGFAYADMIARYKRMTGHAVCYPAGFHASGLPAVSLAKKIARKDEAMLAYLRNNGCPDEVIERLDNPAEVISYFSQVYVDDYWKRFGFLIDYSRLMTTVSPGYKRFIAWQFHKLRDAGLLTRKPHFAPFCPNCGPVAVDRSETDISKGGDAEINEFTVITPGPVPELLERLRIRQIHGGIDVSLNMPGGENALLICVTEMHSKEDIDMLCTILADGG
jgi:leucyl-tRNA synthetase